MKFFKAEDFKPNLELQFISYYGLMYPPESPKHETKSFKDVISCEEAASQANAKIEREAKTIYGNPDSARWEQHWSNHESEKWKTHRGLLINVERSEKCKHPSELVTAVYKSMSRSGDEITGYMCKCGKRVTPTFKAVDEA